ncbi:MAG: hypothetical protein AAF196_04825 [Planctomycetota bacterium]
MSELKKSLKEAVKRLAYNTSVDHLKKKGVKRVNVLGLDRIVSLIEEAVHRSLRHKLVTSEREEIVDATKEEFLKLLKSNEELKARHEAAEEESNNLRIQLDRLQEELTERLNEAEFQRQEDYEGEDEEIARRVAELFERQSADLPEEMRGQVYELIQGVVGEQRREALEAREAARDREVDNLQRRIKKLSASLEATESRLSEVASMKDVETGVASIYREVQGLQGSGKEAERKKELMADIFAANLKLQSKG